MLYRYSIAILGIVAVAGCSIQGGTIAPVEDRTAGSGSNYGSQATQQSESVDTRQGAVEVRPYVAVPVPAPIESLPATGQSPSKPAKTNSAVASLVSIADARVKGGQYDAAANSLERALRYDQKNAELWFRLAEVNLLQHDYAQAESKALKSNALAGGDRSLMAENWRLISKARRLQGDSTGADQAEVRAYQLSR